MAGLGVLLEAHQKTFPKCPQIINKTTLFIKDPSSPSSVLPPSPPLQPTTAFLDRCWLCRRRLLVGQDIYMYRGDRAFCSEECRCRQILMDEESAAAEKILAARRRGKSRTGGGYYY